MADELTSAERDAIAQWLEENEPRVVPTGFSSDFKNKGEVIMGRARAAAAQRYRRDRAKLLALIKNGYEKSENI